MSRAVAPPALAFVLGLLLVGPARGNDVGTLVEIAAPDGFLLKATYWAADGPGPAVLMLHQCNRDRTSWNESARYLKEAGFHVLALDFRGFGGSVGEGVTSFQGQREQLWPLWDGDVDRALDFLGSLPDVDGTRVGAIGASCGGSQALLLASRSEALQALVFLSSSLPWLDEEDVVTFRNNRNLPILGIAAEEDRKTAERTEQMFDASGHSGTRLILYKGEGHGVPLFDQDPSLIGVIVDFFAAHL